MEINTPKTTIIGIKKKRKTLNIPKIKDILTLNIDKIIIQKNNI